MASLCYRVKCVSVFQYLPVEAQAGLCGRQQGEVRGVCVRGSLQGLNQPGGGAHGTRADNVHLPHPEPGENRERGLSGHSAFLHNKISLFSEYYCL